MKRTIGAFVIAAGLLGLGASAQATPLSAGMPAGIGIERPIVEVQMRMERRMMRRRMERRMERRMMRREMRRDMRRDMRRRM